jgi:hypothetical protein
MGRLSRALRHAARWASSWLIAGAVARRAAADARRQAKYAEACLRIARRRTQERDAERRLKESALNDLKQMTEADAHKAGELKAAALTIERLLVERQAYIEDKKADAAESVGRQAKATVQLKLDED